METIILVGGGGHCISCIDVLKMAGFDIKGILDMPEKVGESLCGVPYIGTDDDISKFSAKYKNFLITIGQIKSPQKRINIFEKIKKLGGNLPVVISPRAYVSSFATIGEGTIIMHNSIINANAVIGRCCIINTASLIEHESIIGDFCHISTHSVVNGQAIIGSKSFIGSNSVIVNNIWLPDDMIIGAGACIMRAPLKTGTYIGNPARISHKS